MGKVMLAGGDVGAPKGSHLGVGQEAEGQHLLNGLGLRYGSTNSSASSAATRCVVGGAPPSACKDLQHLPPLSNGDALAQSQNPPASPTHSPLTKTPPTGPNLK